MNRINPNGIYTVIFSALYIFITISCNVQGSDPNSFIVENGRSCIEEIFFQKTEKKVDTILYVKYYIDNDSCILKTAHNLKIGIEFDRHPDWPAGKTFNLKYVGIKNPTEGSTIFKANTEDKGFRLTTFPGENPLAKRSDVGVQIIFDEDDFVYVGEMADENRLKIIKEFFSKELKEVMRNKKCIQYRLVISHQKRAEISESSICF